MQRIDLEVLPRELKPAEGPQTPYQLRKLGFVPGVIYGQGQPEIFSVDIKKFKKALHTDAGTNALFNVTVNGKTALSIIKEIQHDVLTQEPIHVDFLRINIKEKIQVHIAVHLQGVPVGVKEGGGILEHTTREIIIRCLPDDIPAHLDIDVSHLKIHEHISVGDLKLAEGIEVITEDDHIVANVVPIRVEAEPVPVAAEGAAGTQPEVIKKGKELEEGAEAAGGKKAAPAGGDKKGAGDKEAKK